jgi:hypothetical protein
VRLGRDVDRSFHLEPRKGRPAGIPPPANQKED